MAAPQLVSLDPKSRMYNLHLTKMILNFDSQQDKVNEKAAGSKVLKLLNYDDMISALKKYNIYAINEERLTQGKQVNLRIPDLFSGLNFSVSQLEGSLLHCNLYFNNETMDSLSRSDYILDPIQNISDIILNKILRAAGIENRVKTKGDIRRAIIEKIEDEYGAESTPDRYYP